MPPPPPSVADAHAYWDEVAAGRLLQAPPPHQNLPQYLGCCPALACHVYECCAYSCTLREALAEGGAGAPPRQLLLGSWEARVGLCLQLASASAYMLHRGVVARCGAGAGAGHGWGWVGRWALGVTM